MNTKTLFLLLLISISFFSCNGTVKNQSTPISDIVTDFPITGNLEFKPFHKYDIFKDGICTINDSILWVISEGESDFGFCYNLHTGEKLSVIASKGRAANELTQLDDFNFIGDSIQLYTSQNIIKSFAKRDIIKNTPMGERKFSVTIIPDSIWVRRSVKLPNGSILATIMPASAIGEEIRPNGINQKSVVILNDKEAKGYETIKYESFNINEAKSIELPTNELIKCAYCDGSIATKNNDMAVFSVAGQFILYTFDIRSGSVVNEKRYTEMQREKSRDAHSTSLRTANDRNLSIVTLKTNNQYIFCEVDGYFSEEDKEARRQKEALFVFDWKLNPIKRFDLPKRKNGNYELSDDGNAVYFCEFAEDGLTLHKADLNI